MEALISNEFVLTNEKLPLHCEVIVDAAVKVCVRVHVPVWNHLSCLFP